MHEQYIVIDRGHLKELFDAPEENLSFVKAAGDSLELKYTFNNEMARDHCHSIVTRAQLSRHLPELMPAIVDELTSAFDDEFVIGDGTAIR